MTKRRKDINLKMDMEVAFLELILDLHKTLKIQNYLIAAVIGFEIAIIVFGGK